MAGLIREIEFKVKFGWGEKEECVAKIIIDDKAQFAKDTWFAEEAEVMIYYYVRV